MRILARHTVAVVVGAALAVSLLTSAEAQSRRGYCDHVARDFANQQVAGDTVGGAADGSAQWRDAYWSRFNDCMQGY